MQLELFRQSETELARALQAHLGGPIDLTLTNNRSSLLSYKPGDRRQRGRVRMHRMFLQADEQTIEAVGVWLRSRRATRAAARVDAFIRDHEHLLSASTRRTRVKARGRHCDLARLYAETNETEFENCVKAAITWGSNGRTDRPQRSIRLGSYCPHENLIRIHPRLDHEQVPEFFVRYIIFHEMLHADMGIQCGANGRRRIHPPEFKARERRYADFDRAIAWQDHPKNLAYLLGRRSAPG